MSMMTPITLRNNGTGIALSCTDASGSTFVPLVGDGDSVVVTNTGVCDGFISICGATGPAAVAPGSTASYPVLARTKEDQLVINKDMPHSHAAGVCKTGESTVLLVHLVQR